MPMLVRWQSPPTHINGMMVLINYEKDRRGGCTPVRRNAK